MKVTSLKLHVNIIFDTERCTCRLINSKLMRTSRELSVLWLWLLCLSISTSMNGWKCRFRFWWRSRFISSSSKYLLEHGMQWMEMQFLFIICNQCRKKDEKCTHAQLMLVFSMNVCSGYSFRFQLKSQFMTTFLSTYYYTC